MLAGAVFVWGILNIIRINNACVTNLKEKDFQDFQNQNQNPQIFFVLGVTIFKILLLIES